MRNKSHLEKPVDLTETIALTDLSDVTITSAVQYQHLELNGSGEWVNVTNMNLGTGTLTANAFIIGAYTLNVSEWLYLDGQNQHVKTTSSPYFVGLTLSGDLAVNGGDLTSTSATFNLLSTVTTLNMGNTAVTTANIATGAVTSNFGAAGAVNIAPTAAGDITCFGTTDVGDTTDGKSFYVYRKAAEGDGYIRQYIDQYGHCYLQGVPYRAASNFIIDCIGGGDLELQYFAGGDITLFEASASGENRSVKQAGYITAATDEVEVHWTVKDTDDYYWLERETADILGFKIDMPLDLIDNNFTTTGQVQAEHLYSTDDAVIDGDLTVSGEMKGSRIVYNFGYTAGLNGPNTFVLEVGPRVKSGLAASQGYLMPRAGSVVGIAIILDVNASAGGDVDFLARTDNDTTLFTETISAPGVADGHKQYNTFTRGTYTFSAGEVLQVRMDVDAGVTTDDVIVSLEVQFDT